MVVKTAVLGQVDCAACPVIRFPAGLIGLPEYQEFVLLDLPEHPRFKLLQSVKNAQFGLVVTSPFWFKPDYSFTLPDVYAVQLGDGEWEVLVTVTLAAKLQDITVNLLGPLVVSRTAGVGFQVLADKPDYSPRYHLLANWAKGE